jgi:ABC-2 type transport system permease protein
VARRPRDRSLGNQPRRRGALSAARHMTVMRAAGSIAYVAAMVALNFRTLRAQLWGTLTAALMMMGNNLIMFSVWLIYFAKFSSLKGWELRDMALLIGLVAWAFGVMVLFAGGVRHLAQDVIDGRLDVYLGRPRHPLLALLLSRSIPSGFGDLVSAFVLWIWIADCGAAELALLLLLGTAAAVIFVAVLAITQCLVFWAPRAHSLCEDLFNMFMITMFYPQHPYGFAVRVILFTVFPTAVISLLPIEAVREGSAIKVALVLAAAVAYAALAKLVFDRGVRRYASGNSVVEMR